MDGLPPSPALLPHSCRKTMTPTQFTALLSRLGLTQVGAAKALGISDRQMRRYVAGQSDIPPPIVKLLRLVLAGGVTIEDVARL